MRRRAPAPAPVRAGQESDSLLGDPFEATIRVEADRWSNCACAVLRRRPARNGAPRDAAPNRGLRISAAAGRRGGWLIALSRRFFGDARRLLLDPPRVARMGRDTSYRSLHLASTQSWSCLALGRTWSAPPHTETTHERPRRSKGHAHATTQPNLPQSGTTSAHPSKKDGLHSSPVDRFFPRTGRTQPRRHGVRFLRRTIGVRDRS